ncbi:MAG: diacylglycerol kinase family lipid kinase, partial [Candidatus Kapabacteria bacterium]|nr:diacylglycerol kinase family lipid kinase [Candidatus Kapabacteria bacterium]
FSCSSSDCKNVSIGMIPVGTGNDWCRSLKIPENPAQAASLLIKGKTILHDVGTITSTIDSEKIHRYFINVAGIGFDANVAHAVNVDKGNDKRGRILYMKNLLGSLLKSKPSKYRIIVDDNVYDKNIFSMCVGIGKYNGGGMKQLPDAIVDDGLFDITMIENISKFSIIINIKNLFDGSFVNHHKVSVSKGKKILIETEVPVLSETDGESCGQSPFQFNILPRALKVIVPENFETNQNIELS